MSRASIATGFLSAVAGAALAEPIGIPIEPTLSNVTVELCIPGGCDDDSSRVSGFLIVELDDVDAPGEVTLTEFHMFFLDQIDLDINLGIFGRLRATGNGLDIVNLTPPVSITSAVTAGAFEFIDVPADADGTIAYNATGGVCLLIGASGLPCVDTIELADQGAVMADSLGGTLTSVSRVVTMTSSIDLTVPVNPDSPDLGTLHITGTVVGSALVPIECPADLTGSSDPNDPTYGQPDGIVDGSDFFYYLDQFVLGNMSVADLTGTTDPNDPGYGVPDGVLDAGDFFYFLDLFVAGCD